MLAKRMPKQKTLKDVGLHPTRFDMSADQWLERHDEAGRNKPMHLINSTEEKKINLPPSWQRAQKAPNIT